MHSYIIVAVLSFTLTILLDRWIRNPILTVCVAGSAASALFQLGAYVQLGYLEPFFPIAVTMSTLLALAVSAVVLFAYRRLRRVREQGGSHT